MIKRMVRRIIVFIMILMVAGIPVDASAQTGKTPDEVYNIIRENLLVHNPQFTIKMSTKMMNQIGNKSVLYDIVTAIDKKSTSKDGDYLRTTISKWNQNWTWSRLGSASLNISVVYRTTVNQEKKLDAKIKSVLTGLKLTNATDYQKVKAIHDYIIKRVSYDTTFQKHTAYNALINKTSVCEGYSAAAYRMFTDAGIDCRIIIGTADGDTHSWNIVKVDGNWYNIDLTWDDPITNTGEQILRYTYFLKNDKAFVDHTRAEEYSTDAFVAAYPIAENSYKK